MSFAQRLRHSPPRELEREYALVSVGLPVTSISPTRFCEALSRATIAVTTVKTDGPSRHAGVTYSAISTVCDTPPPILLCVNRVSAANSVIKTSAVPSINRLIAGWLDISRLFSGTGQVSMSERVASNRWRYSPTGTPYFNARSQSSWQERIATDERMRTPFPHNIGVHAWFEREQKQVFSSTTSFRNSTLKGGYPIAAARVFGRDGGPMSTFNIAALDEAIFSETPLKSDFLCGPGYGNAERSFVRNPRLSSEEACTPA
ncbi:flavin reductase [Paraburkholderia panacisoli]|uniref:flavin reductase n=1 Tax=Paraburkholderia panacisoli TaxID=2603818 RepID=UPI00165FE26F|nr:flavin reductase [Paraburkholderia panacisoli]